MSDNNHVPLARESSVQEINAPIVDYHENLPVANPVHSEDAEHQTNFYEQAPEIDLSASKVEYADLRDAKNEPGAMVYETPKTGDMNLSNIPDMESLTSEVYQCILEMKTPEVQKMMDTNPAKAVDHMYDKFPNVNYKIINVLMDETLNDEQREHAVLKLLDMFDRLDKCKRGELNLQNEFERFREEQKEEYVYPQFGGKDQYERTVNGMQTADKPKRRRRNKKFFRKK